MGATRPRPWLRIGALTGLFVALTAVGIYIVMPTRASMLASWRHLLALPWYTHLALGALAPALIAAEALRVGVMGRALGVPVGARAALSATVVGNFFTWISPGAVLGEPAMIYMLARRGVPWGAALVIAFGKLAISLVLFMGLTVVLLACGLGPPIPLWLVGSVAIAIGVCVALALALLVGAFFPVATISLIDRIERRARAVGVLSGVRARRVIGRLGTIARDATARLARFRHVGVRMSLMVLTSHLVYYAVYVGILLILAEAFGARSVLATIPVAIIYLCFLFIAPTPGASGIAEASAPVFFGALLPAGSAFAVVIAFRTVTFYLQVIVGAVYIAAIGVAGEITAGARARGPASTETVSE